jgi:hypothetical protein
MIINIMVVNVVCADTYNGGAVDSSTGWFCENQR